MAQRLGVPEQEVAQAFAEIMPHMVDQLIRRAAAARGRRGAGREPQTLEKEIEDVQAKDTTPH
jgi:hypothetical protein